MFRFLALAAAAALAPLAYAQPLTTAFTFQGELKNGAAAPTGVYDFRFTLFDAPAGGTQIGPQLCSDNLFVTAGQVMAQLDFGAQFSGSQRFLEVQVRQDTGLTCSNATGFATLSPRQNLTAAPNAVFALNAGAAASATQLNGQSAAFYQNAANLTTGTISASRLPSPLNLSTSISGSQSVRIENTSTTAGSLGLYSTASGTSLYGLTTGSGYAIQGISSATTGANAGGYFRTDSDTGTGVLGVATASSGLNYGVRGQASSPAGFAGYFTGRSYFSDSVGINSTTPSAPLHVRGVSELVRLEGFAAGSGNVSYVGFHDSGGVRTGYIGDSSNADTSIYVGADTGNVVLFTNAGSVLTAAANGRVGINNSNPGARLSIVETTNAAAVAAFGTGLGVYGSTSSGGGTAVEGLAGNAINGVGVRGDCNGVGGLGSYGVYGSDSGAGNYAVYAMGPFGASGTKAFRIDHPQDPADKYLLHYCHEGPEPQNVYNGKIILNEQGEAVVELPAYFASINKDPRYTLTAIGSPMPMLHIAEEIDEDVLAKAAAAAPAEPAPLVSFRIAGGAPGGKVSWRIDALRNDRWVQRYGAPTEAEKPGREKGKYQHPELYDQPPELQMNPAPTPGQ